MLKTQKLIEEYRDKVDVFFEVVDARAPLSTSNPLLDKLLGSRPRVVVLNKVDLADPWITAEWKRWYESKPETRVALISCKERKNLPTIMKEAEEFFRHKRWFGERKIQAMIVGVPNVGKSSLINALSGGRKASVAPKPGHTKGIQRINCGERLALLDTPGILWHKFEDPEVGVRLAMLGAVKDEILETSDLCERITDFLRRDYPAMAAEYFRMDQTQPDEGTVDCLERWGRKRGMLVKGGLVAWDRVYQTLLAEFRTGRICRFSLESPPQISG
jgi:ribosome biogenesis GTPase A